ncbi:ABC transporter permease [Bifidobacterium sp. 82T24]|uniref:ABC transporter permease n=1 Tax=Bifidobacterium pluvialisilvae TaxID=2834436 RepID=UPI001C564541|nr:ABC transporter permease [Bifidobacterium pluvialisilvae]MBW3088385.1 ABC transporter permease [Bifidobacterium pluvialisilvae]
MLTGISSFTVAASKAASGVTTVVKPKKTVDAAVKTGAAAGAAAKPVAVRKTAAGNGVVGKVSAKAGKWALYLALPVILVAVWAFVGARSASYAMATPQQIVSATIEYAGSGELWLNIAVSIARVLEGFLVAFVAAAVLGVAAGVSRRFERFIDLVMQVLRPIPGIAWIPLAILWFGIGENSKVYIIFIGAFFPMFVNFVDGIKGIDKRYFELGRVYEIPKWRFIRQVVVPAALPQMLTGIRLGLSGAWICVVAAEMIGATSGVGFMLSDGRSMSRPDVVILAMLIIGIVGKLMDDVVEWQRRRIVNWL